MVNTPENRLWQPALSLLLFAAGAALCLAFLSRSFDWTVFGVCLSTITALRWVSFRLSVRRRLGRATRLARAAEVIAQAALAAFYLLAFYLAAAWGSVLWWSTSWWIRLVIALLLVAWVACSLPDVFPRAATRSLRRQWVRAVANSVPLSLPLGIWIVACLSGWLREESLLHCDDYARLASPVSLVFATTEDVTRCPLGETVPIGRYPRKFWQSPDGRWLRFTTQSGNSQHVDGPFDGLVCEVDLAAAAATPRCVGGIYGKSHGIVGASEIDKVFFAAWSLPRDDQGRTSAVFTLPAEAPLTIEAEHRFEGSVADLFFEPRSRTLHIFCDENDRIRSAAWPSFERYPDTMAPIFPGEVRYDPTRDEGVVCSWLTGAAVRGHPLAHRFFGQQAPTFWSIAALSWGCDWNPATRRVYTAVPNLGLLYEVDYDSGQILQKHWVGFGMRSATFDPHRGLVYLTNFLRGEVLAVDAATGATRAGWFVGRFAREAYLSRDGDSLFVGSNLGLVRIRLDGTVVHARNH